MAGKKGGDTRAAAAANGKKVGRPRKAAIAAPAGAVTKTIATEILELDGRPDHKRRCTCGICAGELKKKCDCEAQKLQNEISGEIEQCVWCRTREDHKVCRCQVCGWWDLLEAKDKRIALDSRKYLTDKSEGKAVQPVITEQNRPTEINVTIRRIGS